MATMTLVRERRIEPPTAIRPFRRTYLGSYMPFAGVRYYGIFTDRDIVEGRAKIGPVGWWPEALHPDDEPAKALLAA